MKEIKPEEISQNPFTMIGKQWMLITAGTKEKYNTMTASWGGLGVFWNKNAATIYVRPQRYTKEFIDREDTFSLSFFEEHYRSALSLCGSVSGRDQDKITQAALTGCFDEEAPYFQEASLVLICRKLCHVDLDPAQFDQKQYDSTVYPGKDYHRMYLAEILKVLQK